MHPEVRQVGPGSCPICGMALEPEQVSLDDAPDPELIDMTRRFWIALALTLPVFVIEMGSHLGLMHLVPPAWSNWISLAAGDAGGAVGRRAVLRARLAVAGYAQSQHVHADRDGHRRGLALQRGRHAGAAAVSAGVPRHARRGRGLFRGGGGHHGAGAARARCWNCGRARAPRARSARCSASRRRPRGASTAQGDEDVALDAIAVGDLLAGASRRENSGRRRRHRRAALRRRIDGHRRIDAGVEGGRRTA